MGHLNEMKLKYLLTTPKPKTSILGEISPRNASGAMYAEVPMMVDVNADVALFEANDFAKPKSPSCKIQSL